MTLQELFTVEDKWTKLAVARDSNLRCVDPSNANAVSFCLLGGVEKCYGNGEKYVEIRDIIATEIPDSLPISTWNDHPETTFEDVRELIEKLDI